MQANRINVIINLGVTASNLRASAYVTGQI